MVGGKVFSDKEYIHLEDEINAPTTSLHHIWRFSDTLCVAYGYERHRAVDVLCQTQETIFVDTPVRRYIGSNSFTHNSVSRCAALVVGAIASRLGLHPRFCTYGDISFCHPQKIKL